MGVENDRIRLTAENAEVLIAMLEHKKLKYAIDERSDSRTHIRIHFTGEDLPMTLHIILRADKQICSVFSLMPFKICEEMRNDAAIAVTAANHGLIDGSFDMDMDTGEIRFRLTSCYIGTVLTEELFAYLMFVSARTVDHYNDRFEALNNGTMSLEQFLDLDAEDERR